MWGVGGLNSPPFRKWVSNRIVGGLNPPPLMKWVPGRRGSKFPTFQEVGVGQWGLV